MKIAGHFPGRTAGIPGLFQQTDFKLPYRQVQIRNGLRGGRARALRRIPAAALADDPRHVANLEVGIGAHNDHMLHHIPQFPDIAFPVILLHALDDLRGHDFVLIVSVIEHVQKIETKGQDILPPLAQGRNGNRNHVQPVVQILPKGPILNHFVKVPVGGGNETDVNGLGSDAAHAGDLLHLQHPQKLDLEG